MKTKRVLAKSGSQPELHSNPAADQMIKTMIVNTVLIVNFILILFYSKIFLRIFQGVLGYMHY